MKTKSKWLLAMLMLGLVIMGFSIKVSFKTNRPYSTKIKVYGRMEPDIHKHSADYGLSFYNYKTGRTMVKDVDYFTWEKAKPGDEMNLVISDYHYNNPELGEHGGKIFILGIIIFIIPFGIFLSKGLDNEFDY